MNRNTALFFTEDEKETLIEFVRQHEPIYKFRHPKYKDTELKNRLWEEIGRKLNRSGKQKAAKTKF